MSQNTIWTDIGLKLGAGLVRRKDCTIDELSLVSADASTLFHTLENTEEASLPEYAPALCVLFGLQK